MRPTDWRIAICLGVLGIIGCGTRSSDEDVYPNRPINLIVPFSAGGGTDTYARVFKKAIDDEGLLPQPMVIVNIDGAGATIGSRRAKNAKPDGYTLLLLHDAILTAKASGTVNYGPEAFEPVAGTGEVGMVIAVWKDSPYQDLDDLMNAAISKPDTLPFAANIGALTHYAGLQLEAAAWDKVGRKQEDRENLFRFVPVGGGSKRFAELKGGHIEVTGFSLEEFSSFPQRRTSRPGLFWRAPASRHRGCSNWNGGGLPHRPKEHLLLVGPERNAARPYRCVDQRIGRCPQDRVRRRKDARDAHRVSVDHGLGVADSAQGE